MGVALAFAATVRIVDFSLPSAAAVAAACRGLLPEEFEPATALVLVVGSAATAAVLRACRSALRQLIGIRRLRAGLPIVGPGPGKRTSVIDDDRPLAFCSGLLRPTVYLSRGTVAALNQPELRAVLAHEEHHARRRDPLRLLIARSLADGLFFLPALRQIARRYAALAEIAADEAAVRNSGSPAPLAAALLAFDAHPEAAAVGISPERIDHLEGVRARWELPSLLVAGSAVIAVAVLALSASMAARSGDVVVGVPELAAQACMVVMAAAPLMIGASLILGARRMRRPR